MNESHDISDLRDFAMPSAPSWWPLAPGLSLLILVVLWVLLCVAWWWYQRWKASAYRRAGALLVKDAQSLRELSVALKRVAMVSFGREEVASLYGEEWVKYLEGHCRGVKLTPLVNAGSQQVSSELRAQASKWIRGHQC
ncbi:DUF4381 domain-containing protein [Rubritalea spongiae]|uniref:DUF4381 domain-containing protein n=1 Tax=Rubritalea spongiae TaxID=430797 RepID=A0ABW5E2J0_9BACT